MRCDKCGGNVITRGPAQGLCEECEPMEIERAERDAAQDRYEERVREAEEERQWGY